MTMSKLENFARADWISGTPATRAAIAQAVSALRGALG